MCKIVYLTVHRFDANSRRFTASLAHALRQRNVEVVEEYSFDLLNFWKRHRTYGIALAFDFYHDYVSGSGLTLNKKCSVIGRDFSYELCNAIDRAIPQILWRDFQFVDSENPVWFRFFNKVSSNTKAIFHICNKNIEGDRDIFETNFDVLIKIFTDEILRCLRSDYNHEEYRKRVKAVKLRLNND